MEPSESPDSKDVTTISHGTGASEIANHVESSPTILSYGQASTSGNDQVMAAQPRQGDVNEQQLQSGDVDEQPGSDAAMNPCSSLQALPNQIANVPNYNMNQQHEQLLNNDFNPQLPMNEHQQNGLYDQPPQIRPRRPPLNSRRGTYPAPIRQKIPHFHFSFGNQYWTFNDFSQRVPMADRPRPPLRYRLRQPANVCHRLLMNERQPTNEPQRNGEQNQPPQASPNPPPLISRREVEPGIFEEIYSHRRYRMDRPKMFGVNRCACRNYVNYNHGNSDMITVIMNTPNLSMRYSMTMSRGARFGDLFKAYFGLTRETASTVFVACGRRLRRGDTPRGIGMNNRENIYTFVNSRGYCVLKKIRDSSK
ncbi:uncharacterized protein LOC100574563 [Acyrthosiphon pisum]|uniref:Uncharacterized protein n=1 Tax=Acyrthosiphon pisum TaxID=7029 RepID=A0A8R2H6B5_ACYPI|nr:uncharacterized protein LOC100574563 [Acyrthosiphon pisum]|eukprot:XP_016659925.1 PREDICTED: uncharacterized protein LOC100574563 isoform X1 [Acyrthosiphon pisum]